MAAVRIQAFGFRDWSFFIGRCGILWRRSRHPLPELFKEMHVEGRAPHLGNLPGIAVESELGDGDRATGRLDAEECVAVRSRVGEVRGDPRRVDHEAAQLPPIVGERAYNGSQLGGVRIQSAVGAVDRHVARNKLGKVLEPVLDVAAIERRELVIGHAAKGCTSGLTPRTRSAALGSPPCHCRSAPHVDTALSTPAVEETASVKPLTLVKVLNRHGRIGLESGRDKRVLVAECKWRRAVGWREGLEYAAVDGGIFGERDLDGMEERAAVATGVAVAEVQRRASAARHHEADAVADVVVEAEAVRAADQLDVVTAEDVEELRLSLTEAALGLRREVSVEMRRGVE